MGNDDGETEEHDQEDAPCGEKERQRRVGNAGVRGDIFQNRARPRRANVPIDPRATRRSIGIHNEPLCAPWLRWCGIISYEWYLFHQPAIEWARDLFGPAGGNIFAYEVDGFGDAYCTDDGNVPSLLSLPYLGAVKLDDPIYQNTRRLMLSDLNPYFSRGKAAEGTGGPHVARNMIWPLGITLRALTSTDEKEIHACLVALQKTHAGTGLMHEAFDKDDAAKFTRPWFAWANTLFGELILKTYKERPKLLD